DLVDLDLVDAVLALEAEIFVDPEGDAVDAALVGDGDARRAPEKLLGVEDVVNAFVLPEPAGVDAGARRVEVLPHERIVVRDRHADGLHVFGQLGDDGRIDATQGALEGDVLEDGAFQRRVAAALAYAEERAVERVAAVEPGGGAVDVDLVEGVLPVP